MKIRTWWGSLKEKRRKRVNFKRKTRGRQVKVRKRKIEVKVKRTLKTTRKGGMRSQVKRIKRRKFK